MPTEPEEWRVIAWNGEACEISDRGSVRLLPRPGRRGGELGLRYPKQRVDSNGYWSVSIGGQEVRVHRLVAAAFLDLRPDGAEIRHLDGDSLNSRAGNLAYGTHAENMADSIRHGTHVSLHSHGESNGMAKLTEQQVEEIRIRYAAGGIRQVDLAAEYGVSQVKISQVIRGKGWSHAPGPVGPAPASRLTGKQMTEIRAAYAAGATQQSLAGQYGVHQTHISRIVRGVI